MTRNAAPDAARRSGLPAGWPGLAAVLLLLTTIGATPAPSRLAGPIPAGKWTGYVEQKASITNTLSGVDIYANSEGKGNLDLLVDSEGNVTGVFGAYKAKVVWGTVQLGGQQECGWTVVADVSGKVTLNAAGRPVLSLKLMRRAAESSSYCKPAISGTSMSPWETLLLEAATFSGGKMTGTKIESGPQSADDMLASLAGTGAKIVRTTYWELNSSGASVDVITPEYEQYFLENITLQNTYTALIDWHDNPPGTVHFSLAGQSQDIPGEAEVSAVFNVGQVPAGTNPLQVTATTADGQTSAPLTYDVIIVPLEPWAEKAYFSVAEKVNQVPQNFVLYRGMTQVPQQPLALPYLDLSGMPVIGKLLGKWGIPPFQVDVNLEATSAGGLSNVAPVTGQGGFYLGGDAPSVKMTVTGAAFTNMTPTALLFDHGQANFKIDPASIEKDVGPAQLVPGLTKLYDLPVIGDILEGLLSIWKVTLQLTASGSGTATLAVRPDQSELYFDTGSISPTVGITVKPTLGVQGALWVAVSGTGKGTFTIEIAPQPGLKNCTVSLSAAAEVGFAGAKIASEKSPDFVLAQCVQTALNGKPTLAVYVPSEFARRLRSHIEAAPVRNDGAFAVTRPTWQTGESLLAEGVAPQTELDLALGPGGRMAFVYASGDGAGVSLRLYDGQTWGNPIELGQAPDLAFNPKIAFNAEGNVVAVWVRADGATDPQDLADFARTWEIAYAVVQPDGVVATTGSLTQDQALDFGLRMAHGGDGSLWLAWIKSPSTDMWGPAEAPNQLWAARWQGDGWSEPELVTDGLVGTLSFGLAAHDGETALVIADMDLDSDPATVEDRDLFAYSRDAGGWGPADRVTDNQAIDAFPLVAHYADGAPVVAWLRDGVLVAVDGDLQGEATPWNLAREGQQVDLAGGRLMAGPDGSLDLLWSDFTPGGIGIWRAHRPRNQAWQEPQAVVDGTDGIGLLAAAMREPGDLWLGYSKLAFGPESEVLSARLPVSSDLVVMSATEAPSATGDSGPSGFNCFGVGGMLSMVALSVRRWRNGKPEQARGGGRRQVP